RRLVPVPLHDPPGPDDGHDHGHGASAASTTSATPTPAATAATATATATTAAAATSGPLPCPASAPAPTRSGEAEDPARALLGRQGPPRSLRAIAVRPGRQAVTEAGHDQAPGLPGDAGRRPQVTGAAQSSERRSRSARGQSRRPAGLARSIASGVSSATESSTTSASERASSPG